ncbi:MAG: hypothetical protein HOM11_08705, partial [Methylococcales bacterium]|nr:hypothetical protein [Methylococcales bacterium]
MKILNLLFVFFFSIMIYSTATASSKRVALVIGNSDYANMPLKNPVNDAQDVAAALEGLGFEVIKRTNVTRKGLRKALRTFSERLEKEDVGLFYFAGHGIQVDGRNYLVPIDADVEAEDEVQDESIDVNAVMRKMKNAKNRMNIVILDACRNNPFVSRSYRSTSRGLARMDGPVGSIIAYATAPGSVAADGKQRNGVYTKHFLEALKIPNLTVEQVFKFVRSEVEDETAGKQIPWESSSLKGEFKFNIQITINNNSEPTEDRPSRNIDPSLELTFWNDVKNSNTVAMLDAYLKRFPKGTYAELARIKKEQLLSTNDNSATESVLSGVTYPLTIDVLPTNAMVKILNIKEPYKDSMALSAGRYQISVTRFGYKTQTLWIDIKDKAVSKLISLQKQNQDKEVVGSLQDAYSHYDAELYEKAFPIFLYLVNRGELDAQNHIAWLYMKGYGTQQNYGKALHWYRESANRNNAWAQQKLGYMHREGLGVTANYQEALKWTEQSAAKDNVDALTDMGEMAEYGKGVPKDYAVALQWYMKAAEKGDHWSQFKVGYFYDTGKSVPSDDSKAAYWYEKAADQGNSDALNNLGLLYEFGKGVPVNFDKAFTFYQKAALKGHAKGQDNLGVMYETGQGVKKDYAQAWKWYSKSAIQGFYGAQKRLGSLYSKGLGIKQSDELAVKWYLKAAKQNDAWSQQQLGYMYLNGEGIEQDYEQAKYWLKKSAALDDLNAMANMGWMHHKGLGMPVDLAKALSWYSKAALK